MFFAIASPRVCATGLCNRHQPQKICPVVNDAPAEQSQITILAISSGWPTRPTGIALSNACLTSGTAANSRNIRVSIAPGATALTRTFCFGVFQRDRFGQPVDRVFAGNVDRSPGQNAIRPATEELLTMAPPPVSSIAGISCLSESQTPLTLMSMI